MPMPQITENTYLQQGYVNPDGGYRREIYREEAQFVVNKLAPGTSIHALRRFYNRVKGLERSMDRGRLFDQHKSQLYELQAHAHYAAKRNLVNAFFLTFMDRNVAHAVTNWEQFEGFVKHFESVVAYFPTESGPPRQGGMFNGRRR
ncbi:MAG: type III-A CRISPR-associated protein Csm2 [Sulfobacillus thermosulfidooxidans]|uniref:CRISPR system Cms protein Csm2 n=1 Tax=Sulfobacillus thermosulfidooxidans TaxID=28034 RepID=A0A2T2WT65_SULTH|nr:MAG: type III-A CRISPR-associated protein Csm2 [Sulfobacillus thermosulfidooxidans]